MTGAETEIPAAGSDAEQSAAKSTANPPPEREAPLFRLRTSRLPAVIQAHDRHRAQVSRKRVHRCEASGGGA